MRHIHNRNTTFYWSGDVVQQKDGTLAELKDYDIKSKIKNRNNELIANLTVIKNQPQMGHITIQADSTEWQIGNALWDITLTKDGVATATETINLNIIDGVTDASN